MPLSVGEKLGPYRILVPLGAGGMGDVYQANDTRLDRIVAVKVSKAEFNERFEREARAVAALNHPNICQLYDVGLNYLVMEYIEGTPLKGPLPLDQALKYAAQICDALDAAHKKGIYASRPEARQYSCNEARHQAAGFWPGEVEHRCDQAYDRRHAYNGAHRQE